MSDKKISQLTALSAANLAPSTDVLAIVDTSATETKKIVAQDLINGVLNVASAVGIGTASPGRKLDVVAANNTAIRALSGASGSYVSYGVGRTAEEAYISIAATANNFITGSAAGDLTINNNAGNVLITAGGSATQLYLNTSGNLGLGVTPSAWGTSGTILKALQIGAAGSVAAGTVDPSIHTSQNAYFDGTNWNRIHTGSAAGNYYISGNTHNWRIAASGANPISFTQALTLDASGYLLLNTTSTTGNGKFANAHDSASLATASNSITYTKCQGSNASNNATVDAFTFIDAAGNIIGDVFISGHFYVYVAGASGANGFSGVYSIVTTGNGTSEATLAAVSTVSRGTSPVSSVQIADNGVNGSVKLTITYINNSGVVTGGSAKVSFVGLCSQN